MPFEKGDAQEIERTRLLVRQTVQETLQGLGFDVHDPSQLQADMYYLRKVRHGSEDMGRIVRRSSLALGVSTGLYMIWEAIKSLLHR